MHSLCSLFHLKPLSSIWKPQCILIAWFIDDCSKCRLANSHAFWLVSVTKMRELTSEEISNELWCGKYFLHIWPETHRRRWILTKCTREFPLSSGISGFKCYRQLHLKIARETAFTPAEKSSTTYPSSSLAQNHTTCHQYSVRLVKKNNHQHSPPNRMIDQSVWPVRIIITCPLSRE